MKLYQNETYDLTMLLNYWWMIFWILWLTFNKIFSSVITLYQLKIEESELTDLVARENA